MRQRDTTGCRMRPKISDAEIISAHGASTCVAQARTTPVFLSSNTHARTYVRMATTYSIQDLCLGQNPKASQHSRDAAVVELWTSWSAKTPSLCDALPTQSLLPLFWGVSLCCCKFDS
jgi:hypothetical protein